MCWAPIATRLRVVLEELKKEKSRRQLLKLQLNPDVQPAAPGARVPRPRRAADRPAGALEVSNQCRRLPAVGGIQRGRGGRPCSAVGPQPLASKSEGPSAKPGRVGNVLRQGRRTRSYRNLEVMVGRALDYFGRRTRELDRIRACKTKNNSAFPPHDPVDQDHAKEIQQARGSCLVLAVARL